MTELRNIAFQVGKLESGEWAAVTAESPYFFFVGKTEEDVIGLSKEALNLYFDVSNSAIESPKERTKEIKQKSISTFYSKKIVSGETMVAA